MVTCQMKERIKIVKSTEAERLQRMIRLAFAEGCRPSAVHRAPRSSPELDRLESLATKTWIEVGTDLNFLAEHSLFEFSQLTLEGFLYYFPAYLLGVITFDNKFVRLVEDSLEQVLIPSDTPALTELSAFLIQKLTPPQRQVVVEWLKQRLKRRAGDYPDVYGPNTEGETDYLLAIERWAAA